LPKQNDLTCFSEGWKRCNDLGVLGMIEVKVLAAVFNAQFLEPSKNGFVTEGAFSPLPNPTQVQRVGQAMINGA
jgi:hypothetical protein